MIRFLCVLIVAVYAVNADQHFAQAANSFAAEIYQKAIKGKDGNAIISPASIQSAVSLTMFGASGQTQTEMLRGLKYSAEYSTNNVADGFEAFNDYVEQSGALKIANKIFLNQGFSVKQTFQEVAKKSFKAEAQNLDFSNGNQAADVINTWVKDQTEQKIKELIKPESLSGNTKMVVVNAVYFKGSWKFPFEKSSTFKARFYLNDVDSVETDFMKKSRQFKYGDFEDLDATAVELPYADTDITMTIILPHKKTGLKDIEGKLGSIDLINLSQRMKVKDVILKMPKFKFEFESKLVEPLKKMGMQRMFSNEAEFAGLLDKSGNLKVSDVVHKAFIEVDEEGTRAGAATGVEMSTFSKPRYVHMTVDHPFLFVLKSPTSTLFIGRVVKF